MFTANTDNSVRVLVLTGMGTTLVINPWFAYDPINLPKMFVLCAGSGYLLGNLLFNVSRFRTLKLAFLMLSCLLMLSFLNSFISNEAPWYQQLWGVWGRSTGLLTYCAFLIVMLSALYLASNESLRFTRLAFERLGYFITLYTTLQLMDLDPINWSQKAMVATLGNINFMSSFLGLVSTSYISRLLNERQSYSAKVFFLLLTVLNFILIVISDSIQGIGVLLAGVTLLVTFRIRARLKFFQTFIFFLLTVVCGLIGFLGTAGIGPLSNFRQDTVIFRFDYWRAGINMLFHSPITGIGIDSYGDFYREFRTLEAVNRTGPQRVTNTAHNIFIDIFSGSGIFAGLLFILIVLLTAYSITLGLRQNITNVDFIAFSSMWIGFIVFCLISINQIGVGVWGFIFTGLVNGFLFNSRKKKSDVSFISPEAKKIAQVISRKEKYGTNQEDVSKRETFLRLAIRFSLVLIFGSLAVVPNVADAKFLDAIKNSKLELASRLVSEPGIQDFHREQLIVELSKSGRGAESLLIAKALLQDNPRNWTAWVTVMSSPLSSRKEKVDASRELLKLDPNNVGLRADLTSLPKIEK